MENNTPQNEKEETFTRMFALGRLLKSRVEKGSVLPLSQLETLRFISEVECPTMQDLARYHKITAPSATAQVNELVRVGYLTRVTDQKDRRQVRLEMTSKGKRALKTAIEKRKRVFESLFSALDETDRATFNRILGKIIAAS